MTNTVTFTPAPTGPDAPVENVQQRQPQPQGAEVAAERPAWLPPNFQTVEDYAKSLGETQAELTRAKQELAQLKKQSQPADPAAQTPQDGNTPPADKKPDTTGKTPEGKRLEVGEEEGGEVEQITPDAFAEYEQEFITTGDVSEGGREKIAKHPALKAFGEHARSLVDDYIEGAKTRVANTTAQLKAIAGGEQGYSEMIQWARTNLPKAEIEAFNRQVNSGDFHAASFAINALKAKHVAAVGKAPNLVTGDNVEVSTTGFASLHAMKEAMKDPRYETDPDYRKMVEQRVRISNI